MNRKRLGLLAVAFVLVIGLMEVLALKVGSLEFSLPDKKPAVADKT
ncbi:hypothetical protein AGRA3207_002808 [Actinomadura graeca]|uniref:Uncharacterized protein n=1 Tax=Actinomadura graeca TaxID=2750812 RepID=A0ABX8QSV7_9ACTN|nr:hypothetical protein [Actinomadura graeca]QXJ21899.1 hypothetical protein AGRA3207_002808 [Actinomadura graeca]